MEGTETVQPVNETSLWLTPDARGTRSGSFEDNFTVVEEIERSTPTTHRDKSPNRTHTNFIKTKKSKAAMRKFLLGNISPSKEPTTVNTTITTTSSPPSLPQEKVFLYYIIFIFYIFTFLFL